MPMTCSSCGAPIVWARTEKGKMMPLNAETEHRIIREEDPSDGMPICRVVEVYTSHFATCPNAAQHRKGGR